MSLFKQIEAYRGRSAFTATLLDKEQAGAKALISHGEIQWEKGGGFFTEHLADFSGMEETGIVEVAGKPVFLDCISLEKHMVICGGGHVSIPMIRMGKMLGFAVTVLEDRPMFADNARRAGADEVICDSFANGLSRMAGGPDTYFIVVTRGHRYDQACLEQILKKPAAYVGMMGSRARAAIVKRNLTECGLPAEAVEAVHTPIGLDIHAETPEEIAVSVMGEIIQVKNRQKRSFGYPGELLAALVKQEEEGTPYVLATIIRRRGSAPREIGTKMLIRPDGQMTGTIGGGCMEAEVRSQALQMLRREGPILQISNVNMAAKDAEEEGMVCGGNIDVLLEKIN